MPLVPALALLLVAKAPIDLGIAPAPRPAIVGGCPADARFEVNLAAWRAALAQAEHDETSARRDELLAQVGLSLDAPGPDDADAKPPRLELAGVEDSAVQLEAGERAAHVLQVRYRLAGVEDAPTIHLVQVLRPLPGRAYCALGAELSRREEPPAKLVSYALAFVPLVSANAKVIQVESVVGEARRSETRRAYFVARGAKLQKIFDEPLGSMTNAGGATTTTVGTLKLAGDYPKRIELTETTKAGGCEVRAGDAPCEDHAPSATTTTTFVFDGTRYVRKK
ncbi:MAG TPA: hypothetical protein VHL80_19920 [Polyangia bacterium]|nr:hypothetical protein [Polyangia bacterium]